MDTCSVTYDIDILESNLFEFDPCLLNILLKDKTSKQNILWATTDYIDCGEGYEESSPILPTQIIGAHHTLIQPRVTKTVAEQAMRTKNKAEVFTPSWVCNSQNNLVDEQWFGRKGVFNTENGTTWTPTEGHIVFSDPQKTWKKYVDAKRLEITCGEAPYLVSRYDTVTGKKLTINQRIGLLDRKLRIVNENAADDAEWLKWSKRAIQSIYGYEFQGDNLLLARENVLLTYVDYFNDRFGVLPERKHLRTIAHIIAWNIWQMDGMKYVIPGSCHDTVEDEAQSFLFDDAERKTVPCPGCQKNSAHEHNGIYSIIQDWRDKSCLPFISMIEEGR